MLKSAAAMASHDEKADEGLEAMRKQMNYPLIKVRDRARTPHPRPRRPTARRPRQNCDMNEEMRQDCVELVVTAAERFQHNFEERATHRGRRARLPPALRAAPPADRAAASAPPPRRRTPRADCHSRLWRTECRAAGEGDDGQKVQHVLGRDHGGGLRLRGARAPHSRAPASPPRDPLPDGAHTRAGYRLPVSRASRTLGAHRR